MQNSAPFFIIIYYFSLYFAALLCKISAIRSFSMDKLHFKRECDAGMSTLAYFLSKDTIDLFNILIKPLVFLSMFYSFSNPRSTFPENYIIVLCLMYCVTGIGYVFAIALQPAQAQLVANSHSIFLLSHLVFFLRLTIQFSFTVVRASSRCSYSHCESR